MWFYAKKPIYSIGFQRYIQHISMITIVIILIPIIIILISISISSLLNIYLHNPISLSQIATLHSLTIIHSGIDEHLASQIGHHERRSSTLRNPGHAPAMPVVLKPGERVLYLRQVPAKNFAKNSLFRTKKHVICEVCLCGFLFRVMEKHKTLSRNPLSRPASVIDARVAGGRPSLVMTYIASYMFINPRVNDRQRMKSRHL